MEPDQKQYNGGGANMANTDISDTNPAEKTCKSCAYFRLHYLRNSRGKYREMAYGHCMEPRLKIRFANNKACQHWQGRGESQ